MFLLCLLSVLPFAAAMTCPNGIECPYGCCTYMDSYHCCDHPIWFPAPHLGIILGCIILSIFLSCILSLLCCFCCPGCWWYKRRRHNGDSVYYSDYPNHFGFPGTVIFTSYPPPPPPMPGQASTSYYSPAPPYSDSSTIKSSQKSRVRFNNETGVKSMA